MFSRRAFTTILQQQQQLAWSAMRNVTLVQLEELILSSTTPLNGLNCSQAIFKLGKLQSKNTRAIAKVMQSVQCGAEFNPSQLVQVCYGIAKGRLAREIPANITRQVAGLKLARCDSQDFSMLVWSFAKTRQFQLFDWFLQEFMQRDLTCFNPQSLTNVLWGLAERNKPLPPSLMDKLDQVRVDEFNAHDVALAFWSLANLQHSCCCQSQRMTSIQQRLIKEMTREGALKAYTSEAIANVLWSCAKLEFAREDEDDNGLIKALVREIETRDLSTWKPRALSNTVGALGRLNAYCPFALDHISKEINSPGNRLAKFPVGDLVALMHGFANLRHHASCESIAQELLRRAPREFDGRAIGTLFWAFARLHYRDVELCKMLTERALTILDTLSPHDLAQLIAGMAKMDYKNEVLAQRVATKTQSLKDFSAQAMLNLLWGYACMDMLNDPNVMNLFALDLTIQNSKTREQAFQLAQTTLAWRLAGHPPSRLLNSLTDDEGWIAQHLEGAVERPSQMHQRIASVLLAKFPDLKVEHSLAPGVVVDIYLPHQRLCIEVDGPKHFFRNGNHAVGKDAFKRRLVERLGYKLVSLQTQAIWDAEQKEFTRAILEKVTIFT